MATFGQYFYQVYKCDDHEVTLDCSPAKDIVPLLSKDRVNRVLIYTGGFNPPHVGHLGVLCHAFQNSPDFNFVAGIVYPLDDEQIEQKNVRSNRWLALSEEQRSELWERDGRFPAWAFAPRNKYATMDEFQTEIAKAAKQDGYNILYSRVVGPDKWNTAWPLRHTSSTFPEYLISDAGRLASFVSPEGVPQPVAHYTAWQRMKPDLQQKVDQPQHKELQVGVLKSHPSVGTSIAALTGSGVELSQLRRLKTSEGSIPVSSSSTSSTAVTGDCTPASSVKDITDYQETTETVRYAQEDAIWECFEQCTECHENCDLGIRLRYICKKNRKIGFLGDVANEISSSALYPIIVESNGEDRRQRLQDQVLSPDLFCDLLLRAGFDYHKLAAPSLSKYDEALRNKEYEVAWLQHLASKHIRNYEREIDEARCRVSDLRFLARE